ncbi:unnamed protein product, partial [Allacma fusca]
IAYSHYLLSSFSNLVFHNDCHNSRCFRHLPIGAPMANGFKRCPRCWLLTHPCGRHSLAYEVHLNNVNLEEVDPIFFKCSATTTSCSTTKT